MFIKFITFATFATFIMCIAALAISRCVLIRHSDGVRLHDGAHITLDPEVLAVVPAGVPREYLKTCPPEYPVSARRIAGAGRCHPGRSRREEYPM
jgi:hypothetical protein